MIKRGTAPDIPVVYKNRDFAVLFYLVRGELLRKKHHFLFYA
jgi:hypothetical protein